MNFLRRNAATSALFRSNHSPPTRFSVTVVASKPLDHGVGNAVDVSLGKTKRLGGHGGNRTTQVACINSEFPLKGLGKRIGAAQDSGDGEKENAGYGESTRNR